MARLPSTEQKLQLWYHSLEKQDFRNVRTHFLIMGCINFKLFFNTVKLKTRSLSRRKSFSTLLIRSILNQRQTTMTFLKI